MLHRVSKKNDVNKDKWIGVGGHFENRESPEECLLREVYEETGLRLTSYRYRGIVTFVFEDEPAEYMSLYTADGSIFLFKLFVQAFASVQSSSSILGSSAAIFSSENWQVPTAL